MIEVNGQEIRKMSEPREFKKVNGVEVRKVSEIQKLLKQAAMQIGAGGSAGTIIFLF